MKGNDLPLPAFVLGVLYRPNFVLNVQWVIGEQTPVNVFVSSHLRENASFLLLAVWIDSLAYRSLVYEGFDHADAWVDCKFLFRLVPCTSVHCGQF